MRMKLDLRVTPTITPQMILSLTVLQYSGQELEEYLSELSYENPVMEITHREPENKPDEFLQQLCWLKSCDRQNKIYYQDQEETGITPVVAAKESDTLPKFLKEQILTLPISREKRRIMEIIVELLNAKGFFDGELTEIVALSGCSIPEAEDALETIKTLEPPGVGTRDVREALLSQLQKLPEPNVVARQLVEQHYHHMASWSVYKLSEAMSVSVQDIRAAMDVVSTLNPYPGSGFAGYEEIQYIRPDLFVVEKEGVLTVTSGEEYIPNISVNQEYLKMMETEDDPEVQRYLRKKLEQLELVMKGLNNRKSTMLRCAEIILQQQEAFFRGGHLTKMTLRDVAEEMGVHESTVSRTVRLKYIQCDRGIFEMGMFFSRDAGQNVGINRDYIKDRLEDVVRNEEPWKPLSDEKISQILAGENIVISRRTVAKYRMELGILPASARKTYNTD